MKEFSELEIDEAIQIITNSFSDATQIDAICSHDEKVVVTAGPLTIKKLKSSGLNGDSAYGDVDFILFSKADAQNIIDILNEAIFKLENDDNKDDIGEYLARRPFRIKESMNSCILLMNMNEKRKPRLLKKSNNYKK